MLTGIILLYVGLIPVQHWHIDEYDALILLKQGIFSYLGHRLKWSPRPVSELILFCYFLVVKYTHAPMITLMLSLCWMTLIGALGIGLLRGLPDGKRSESILCRLVLLLALFCMYLVGEPPAEIFFWTQGAVAYLITLSAVTALLFYEITSSTNQTTIPCLLLIIGAGSSEMGAMFAASYSGIQLLRSMKTRKPVSTYIAPAIVLCISSVLILLVIHGRVGVRELLAPTHERLNWFISMRLGIIYFALDLFHTVDFYFLDLSTGYLLFTLLLTGSVWLGIAACLPATGYKSSNALVPFITAAFLTCFGSFFAAEYQFGGACCPRHESLRQAFVVLAIIALALRYSPIDQSWSRFTVLAPLLLCLPIIALWAIQAPSLAHDLLRYSEFREARERTWQSGNSSSTEMVFVNPPNAQVFSALYIKPGFYALIRGYQPSDDAVVATLLMQFFDKKTLQAISPFGK